MQSLAVLLCNPFGQEAIRTHRLFRVLAMRLAKAGIHVLRFDYFGTGDSAGDDDQVDLQGWCADIQTAHEELVRLSGSAKVTWVAPRLGAVPAIQALGQSARSAQRLVMWDPVVEAPAYAQLLRRKHVEALETSYSVPDPTWRARLAKDPEAFSGEAIGFTISPTMRKQLSALHSTQLSVPSAVEATVIADPEDRDVAAWVGAQQALGVRLQSVGLKHTLEWTSDDSLNAALVPADAVHQLMLAIDR